MRYAHPVQIRGIGAMQDEGDGFRQTGWPVLRGRLFHFWFLMRRPMTLGVRAVVHDAGRNAVFLVRHTYVPGWQLPGGGVETGETLMQALLRELAEEANIEPTAPPELLSVHFNRRASRRDHVAVYLVSSYLRSGPRRPDHEIAEADFFPVDALPPGTSPGARARIAEALDGIAPSHHW